MVKLRTELLTETANDAYGFLRRDYRRLSVNLLKIEVISLVMMIMTMVFLYSAIFISAQQPSAFYGSLTMAALTGGLILLIGLVGGYFTAVANSVGYNVVDAAYRKAGMRYEETFRSNMSPIFRFALVDILINAVVFLPFILLFIGIAFLAMGGIGTAATITLINIAQLFFRLIMGLIGAVLYLFFQFAIFELLIGKKGAIDSFKGSFGIMSSYPLETFVFSFGLWAVLTGISIPFAIIFILLFIFAAGAGIGMSSIGGVLAFWPLLIVGGLFFLALLLIFSVIMNVVLYAAQYIYWSKVRQPSG